MRGNFDSYCKISYIGTHGQVAEQQSFSPDTRDVHLTSDRAETQMVSIHSLEVWCRPTSPRDQSPKYLSHRPDSLCLQEAGKINTARIAIT